MPTFYLDYEQGNDNYGGTSFAVLASGADGTITSSTFSAASANFPNDGSLIGQYISINATGIPNIYYTYVITAWISSTSLTIAAISGGLSLANTSSRQYYIGGRWKTISTTGATANRLVPGDTIRIMGSPDPTSIGNATWTDASYYQLSNVVAATNASPIVVTCASTMATLGISNGDTVLITGTVGNIGTNGVWTVSGVSGSTCQLVGSTGTGAWTSGGTLRKITNRIVTLASAVTQSIASHGNRGEGRTAWTASANVTTSLLDTDTKEGDVCDSIAVGASFANGLAAYKATGTLNLSGYQQLSFFIKQTSGTITVNGDISIRLCSDAVGATSVHTFSVPAIVALNQWVPFTIDLGSAMSTSIASVALYVDTDRGAQTFLISNIIACKAPSSADSLSLQSLISKNTGDELWYPIMSIKGTRVFLGNGANWNIYSSTTPRLGYDGTTETVTTYKRETIKTAMGSAIGSVIQEVQEAGTVSAPFNYEGGWDRTNMSTQNLITYFDGLNGFGYPLVINTKSYVNTNKLGFVRYGRGLRLITSQASTHGFLDAIGNTDYGMDFNSATSFNTYTEIRSCSNNGPNINHIFGNNSNIYQKVISKSCTSVAFYIVQGFSNNRINNIIANTSSYGVFAESGGTDNIFTSGTFRYNITNGARYYGSKGDTFVNCTTSGNNNSSGPGFFLFGGDFYLKNCIITEPTEFDHYGGSNSRIYSASHDNTIGNHLVTTDYGTIRPQTTVRYSNTGYAWAMSPTNATWRTSSYPLDFKIANIAVSANGLVTIKAWLRRTNTALTMRLRVKGGQISGVSNDVTATMTAAADTWEQVSMTFTPTEAGVIELLAECWGGSTYTGYIDDLSIIQA